MEITPIIQPTGTTNPEATNQPPKVNSQPAPINQRPASKQWFKRTGVIISTIFIILLAPTVALLLTIFVFQQYQVDGPSMQTTLYTGNRLIVWKWPETLARITGHPYLPKRGTIVVFNE